MTNLIIGAVMLAMAPSSTFAGSAQDQLKAAVGADSAPRAPEITGLREIPALRNYIQSEWKGNWNPAWERSLSEGAPLIQMKDGSWQLTPEAYSHFRALAQRAYRDIRKGSGRSWAVNEVKWLALDGGFLNRNFVERKASVNAAIGKDETVALHGISMESEVSLDGHLNTSRESWETRYSFQISGKGMVNPQIQFEYTDGAGAGHTGGLTSKVKGETTLENPRVLAILEMNLRFWLRRPAY